jgi:hypothetical protein
VCVGVGGGGLSEPKQAIAVDDAEADTSCRERSQRHSQLVGDAAREGNANSPTAVGGIQRDHRNDEWKNALVPQSI